MLVEAQASYDHADPRDDVEHRRLRGQCQIDASVLAKAKGGNA